MKEDVYLLAYLKDQYSSSSYLGYYKQIKRYRLYMAGEEQNASEKQILGYLDTLRKQGLHPKSLRNHLFAIKIYYRYLQEAGSIENHPCKYLYLKDAINRQIALETLYSYQMLEELYHNWKSKSRANQNRDKVIIGLLIYQALSVREITELKIQDIDLEQASIFIRSTGQNQSRKLALKSVQLATLLYYLQERKKLSGDCLLLSKEQKPFWTGAINRIINQSRDNKNKLSALKIRQSVIRHLLKEGKDIRVVQAFAGHQRTSSTESYKQTGLEDLKQAIDKLHPLQ